MPRGVYPRTKKPKLTRRAPNEPVSDRGRPGRMPPQTRQVDTGAEIQVTARELDDRAKRLSARVKVRKHVALTVTLDDYDAFLTLAERFGENLQVVAAACFLHGLDHYKVWASSAGPSPFSRGYRETPRPSQLDPSGGGFPPPPTTAPFVRPPALTAGFGFTPPPGRTVVSEVVEPVYSRPIPAGVLPSAGGVAPVEEPPALPPQTVDLGLDEIPFEPGEMTEPPTLGDNPAVA